MAVKNNDKKSDRIMIALQSFPEIGVGDTFPSFQFKLKDPVNVGQYLDLTNYTFCAQIKLNSGGKVYHEFTSATATDTVTFDEFIANIPANRYLLDIKTIDGGGFIVHTKKYYVPILDTISSC